MNTQETKAQQALARLQLVRTRGDEEVQAWFHLLDLIGTTAVDRGLWGESLMRLLRDDRFVLGGAGKHDAQFLLRLRDECVAVLADEFCVPRLIELLDEVYQRPWAAAMLGWFGPAARAALPKLVDVASMGSWATRPAKESVLLIGGAEEEIARQLRDSVTDGDDGNFCELCGLVGMAGYGSSGWFLEILEAAGRAGSPHIRELVAGMIEGLSPEDRRKLKPTLELLRADPVDFVRESASEVPDD